MTAVGDLMAHNLVVTLAGRHHIWQPQPVRAVIRIALIADANSGVSVLICGDTVMCRPRGAGPHTGDAGVLLYHLGRQRREPAGEHHESWPRVESAPVTTEQDIRRIACSLPGAFERESYGGGPSWRTLLRMFAWIRDDPEALVVWVESLEAKEALITADPSKFFTISHYNGQPIVLVRLEATEVTEAHELVTDSWRVRTPRSLTRGHDRGADRPPP